MTRTSLGGSSPSFCFSKSCCLELDVKAMNRPSGDHTGALAPFGMAVSGRASPPSIGST